VSSLIFIENIDKIFTLNLSTHIFWNFAIFDESINHKIDTFEKILICRALNVPLCAFEARERVRTRFVFTNMPRGGILRREGFDGSCSWELTRAYTRARACARYIVYGRCTCTRGITEGSTIHVCRTYVGLYIHRRQPRTPRGHVSFARDIPSLPSLELSACVFHFTDYARMNSLFTYARAITPKRLNIVWSKIY